ncbi:MAG: AfsR/SARP family transcriptional regulator [Actinobacteria bacterium]|nr:AfsR/SARP family transcriptional regulator [Actinomycetota bacterium]
MDYRILGPVEALDGERRIPLGGARQRAVLALLLLHGNVTLTRDVIIDELWGDEAPPTAAKVLQNCVSALRKELPPDTIRTVSGAYCLALEPDELDRDRFERLLSEGRAALTAGDYSDALDRLHAALALWHGAPLTDLSYERFAQDEVTRLDELHVAALEDRFEAELALGRHDELVPELEALVTRQPLRERLRAQLMLALYRAGRQAEALDAYRAARRTLLTELGIEPGRALHELEHAILAQDPALDVALRQHAGDLSPRPRCRRTARRARSGDRATPGRARRRARRPRQALRRRRGIRERQEPTRRRRGQHRKAARNANPVGSWLGRRRRSAVLALDAGVARRVAGFPRKARRAVPFLHRSHGSAAD